VVFQRFKGCFNIGWLHAEGVNPEAAEPGTGGMGIGGVGVVALGGEIEERVARETFAMSEARAGQGEACAGREAEGDATRLQGIGGERREGRGELREQ
jgi:hypothetical protein